MSFKNQAQQLAGIVRADDVSKDAYVSSGFAELAGERLWPRIWQVACPAEEISQVGDFSTNAYARVVRADCVPTASLTGRTYPSAGASTSAASVFDYSAARHAADSFQSTLPKHLATGIHQ